VRIAVPDFVSSTSFPLFTAKVLGIFEKEGQEVADPALICSRAFLYTGSHSKVFLREAGERYDLPFDELKQGRLVAGSPEEVFEDVMSYHKEFGAEFMWFMIDWPGFEPQWALETIELFGQRVIPEIKRLTPACPLP
jgi:hypothetical protein